MSVKKICIIGAGPGGLSALKVIRESSQCQHGLWEVTAYEARESAGGVWLPAQPVDNPPLTPLYDSLTTNLPHPIMAYMSHSFPPSTYIFPPADTVLKYLLSFIDRFELKPYIQLNTRVEKASRTSSGWSVRLGSGETRDFDFIVVGNGHYNKPRYPDAPGVKQWVESKRAIHAAWYRHPGKKYNKVLIVGGGPSGQDISREMSTVSRTLIQSTTSGISSEEGNIKQRSLITQYDPDGTIHFVDGSTETGIEFAVFATGYEMHFPFFDEDVLHLSITPSFSPPPHDLYNSSYNVFPLSKHIFPLNEPTIAFVGLPIKAIPFPLMEAQAHAIVRVFSDISSWDPTALSSEIVDRYNRLTTELGSSDPATLCRSWFVVKDKEQFDYRDELHRFSGIHDIVVPVWVRELGPERMLMKKAWADIVSKGEAEEWVRGVGENVYEEWVDVLYKLLQRGKELNL